MIGRLKFIFTISEITAKLWYKYIMDFSINTNKRPQIGLSPMAGYTDSPFRQICRQMGADFVITELVSAEGIVHMRKSKLRLSKTYELMNFNASERPILVQLFGADSEIMREAAKIVAEELKPDGININMGCPAHKVVCNGKGSALMKDPNLAAQIVTAAIEGSGLPVSVKTRLGWEDESKLIEFSKSIESAGAECIMIHGRTYKQGFSGIANWLPIYEVKKSLKIPVLGNGDIWSLNDYQEKIGNLDGVLIGRGAVTNPWMFAEIAALQNGQQLSIENNWEAKLKILDEYAQLKFEYKGTRGIIELRKFVLSLLKGFPNATEIRLLATQIKCLKDVQDIINKVKVLTV
jgi:tRNA-dihydrouridine synthase B